MAQPTNPPAVTPWTAQPRYAAMQYAELKIPHQQHESKPVQTFGLSSLQDNTVAKAKLLKDAIEPIDKDNYRMKLDYAKSNHEACKKSQNEFKCVFKAVIDRHEDDDSAESELKPKVEEVKNACSTSGGIARYLLWKSGGRVERAVQKFWQQPDKYQGTKYFTKVITPNGAQSISLMAPGVSLQSIVDKTKQLAVDAEISHGNDLPILVFVNGLQTGITLSLGDCDVDVEGCNRILVARIVD